jgi:lysophospholipase L1-like esterase
MTRFLGSARFLRMALPLLGLLLLASRVPRAQAPSSLVSPTLAPNPDLVICAPYDTIAFGIANWGTGARGVVHAREFLTLGNRYRLRQSGTVRRIRVNLANPAGLTGFYVRIWRHQGRTFDRVGSSENLAPRMAAGLNTLDLQRPIDAEEGDYYGYRVESANAANFFARTGQPGVNSYYVTDASPGGAGFDWQAQTVRAGSVLPIRIFMPAPLLVGIGTSIMAGHPAHLTFLEDRAEPREEPVPYRSTDPLWDLGEQWGVTRQNMGIGGQTTTQIAARFNADVLDLKPRLALIQGGTNDIGYGTVTLATFLSNWKRMLDACQASGIKPLVLLINMRTVYSTAQSQQRERWNASLRSLAGRYPRAVVIDPSPYVGTARLGGPLHNLWNIDPAYGAGDGIHFNPAGYRQIAQAIVDQYTEP